MAQTQAIARPPLVIPPTLMRRPHMRTWLTIVGLVASAILAALAALALFRPAGQSPRFRTVPIERRTITRAVEANGELDVPRRFEVAAPIKGRLMEIYVESGARVKQGDLLARLDPRLASLDLRSARAEERAANGRLSDAEARYSTAVETRQRIERMVGLKLLHPRYLSDAKSNEKSALGARNAARADRDAAATKRAAAELASGELVLRAPANGLVLSLPSKTGELVGPERGALFTIGDTLDELQLRAFVAEADIGTVHTGQSAHFSVPAFAERNFSARVERVLIEPAQKQGVVTYPVLLVADNRDHKLLPGMTANVSIDVAAVRGVLAVREAALRFTPEGAEPVAPRTRIWTSRDGIRLVPVAVSAGLSDGAYTQVEPGPGTSLAPGDPAVVGMLPQARAESTAPGIRFGRRQ